MKKIKLLAPFLSVVATAGAIIPVTVGCNKENDDGKTYTVSLSQDETDKEFTDNVTLDVTEVKKGEDYLGKVTVKDSSKFQLVNQSITVTGIGSIAPKITYVKDEKTGSFTSAIIEISKDNILDNLTIGGKLAEYIAPLVFTAETGEMVDDASHATLAIKWEPQRDITFDTSEVTPTFDYDGYKEATVTSIKITQSGTAKVSLSFNEPIIIDDINDGILTFTYTDVKLAKQQRIEIRNVAISKYVPEELEFYVDSPTMSNIYETEIQLMWAGGGVEITEISGISFKYDDDQKEALFAETYSITNPCLIDLTFKEPMAFNDITDGHLTFTYNGTETGEVSGINIHKYTPGPYDAIFTVTQAYAQQDGGSTYIHLELDWLPKIAFTLSNIKFASLNKGIECIWTTVENIDENKNEISVECKNITESLDDGTLTFNYDNGAGLSGPIGLFFIHLEYYP